MKTLFTNIIKAIKNMNIETQKTNSFRVKQLSDNEFIIERLSVEITTKGYLWWKKEEVKDVWRRVNKLGHSMFDIRSVITYKTLIGAKYWITNHIKYPKYHYLTKDEK